MDDLFSTLDDEEQEEELEAMKPMHADDESKGVENFNFDEVVMQDQGFVDEAGPMIQESLNLGKDDGFSLQSSKEDA